MNSRIAVLFVAGLLTAIGSSQPGFAAPKVVATIPPVHSLAAMVMEGAGFPDLLLDGGETPHSYALRPSQSRLLSNADLIIRVGDGLEGFLKKPLRALGGKARIITLEKVKGIVTYPVRGKDDDGHHDHHGHGHGHNHGHEHGTDPHLWLHTGNAIAVVTEIAKILSALDPENAPVYKGNSARAQIRLRALKQEIDQFLSPVRARPYFVFHDAWQYFEKEFHLRGGGAIAVSPERKPGARRLSEIRARIRTSGARCVFAEPQFPPALVKTVIRGTTAKLSSLDPLGATLTRGPGMYPALMRNLAKGMISCLNSPTR